MSERLFCVLFAQTVERLIEAVSDVRRQFRFGSEQVSVGGMEVVRNEECSGEWRYTIAAVLPANVSYQRLADYCETRFSAVVKRSSFGIGSIYVLLPPEPDECLVVETTSHTAVAAQTPPAGWPALPPR